MDSVDLSPENEGLTLEVSIDRIDDAFCKQGIQETDWEESDYFYLAAIALECKDDSNYDISDVLCEYIDAGEIVGIEYEEAEKIKGILQG
jgi:hypothetical protein